MFSQTSVILFTEGGGVWQTPPNRHPPWQTPPDDTPRQTHSQQISPWADTHPWADTTPWQTTLRANTPRQIPPRQTQPPLPSACWDTHLLCRCACWDTHTPCPVHAEIHPGGHCSGWYASYWNAFLFTEILFQKFMKAFYPF